MSEEIEYPIHCFKCDKELERFDNNNFNDPPDNATYWRTTGNFGSRVYDQCGEPGELEIYICDECLRVSNRVYEVITTITRVTIGKVKTFQ